MSDKKKKNKYGVGPPTNELQTGGERHILHNHGGDTVSGRDCDR